MNPQEVLKQQAAEAAVRFVDSGMRVGLGTGSTAIYATRQIGALLASGQLQDIEAFATSRATDAAARELGIPMIDDDLPCDLDITIDGADEVDPNLDLIKGGGGALLREKIVAQASARVVIVADASKPSPQLGMQWAVPVEVLSFAWRSQARFVTSLGATWTVRSTPDGSPFATDSGNIILDCAFGPIADPAGLADALAGRAGIVEHGLFLGIATDLIIATADGVEHRTRAA
jgi:ribose 5-phosphate isomerase A